jgi:diguanylate cyclase (GGDEF)-like protein
MAIFANLSIINKGLRYKLAVAFSLMTVIPLLSCAYIIYPQIFPVKPSGANVDLVLFLSLVISVLGLIVARSIADSVVSLAMDAKKIAGGEYERRIPVSSDDEIGNLGQSINLMSQKIKSNLEELKGYGQSMKDINVEIHKKVLALSSLLQIGDVISSGTPQVDLLLSLAVEKAAGLFDSGYGVLYLARGNTGEFIAKTSHNIEKEKLGELVVRFGGGAVLDKALQGRKPLKIDGSTKITKELEEFRKACNVRNILAVPLGSDRAVFGLFVIGSRLSDFRYSADDVDLIAVFAKHITIAIESDVLNRKNEELVTRDDLTGLFNRRFISMRLEEEIKRAIFYQRPCSLIVINIDGFRKFREEHGELSAEEALKRVAKVVKDNAGPVGKAARLGGDEFGVLFPEKNKREAGYLAEEIRKKIEALNVSQEARASVTVSVGVSENPIDGATTDELFKRASDAVKEAKASGGNRVVS